ncbi:hypothetical protein [Xanthomonas phage Xp15]|uniref:Uncharacterized protein n=1 Tax=Xanthomonas phage Xp15 TaxID=322855 RepID=Q52PT0_9CAUD|nr:hypothetical protein XPXV15_gp81 [Xanthomonas phage Xp15]AAX84915.1 hypothetical protein [Xanthomonas phage Xp15]
MASSKKSTIVTLFSITILAPVIFVIALVVGCLKALLHHK